jgi:hypothetical protein
MSTHYTKRDPWEGNTKAKHADFSAYNHLQNGIYTNKVNISALLEGTHLRRAQVATSQEIIMRIAAKATRTVHNSWCEHCRRAKHREFPSLTTPLETLMYVLTNGRMGHCPGCGSGLTCLNLHQALSHAIRNGAVDVSSILLDRTERKDLLAAIDHIPRVAANAAGLTYYLRQCDHCEYGMRSHSTTS